MCMACGTRAVYGVGGLIPNIERGSLILGEVTRAEDETQYRDLRGEVHTMVCRKTVRW